MGSLGSLPLAGIEPECMVGVKLDLALPARSGSFRALAGSRNSLLAGRGSLGPPGALARQVLAWTWGWRGAHSPRIPLF